MSVSFTGKLTRCRASRNTLGVTQGVFARLVKGSNKGFLRILTFKANQEKGKTLAKLKAPTQQMVERGEKTHSGTVSHFRNGTESIS